MPRIKPPESEARPATAEANPDDHLPTGHPCSLAFKLVSGLAAGFLVLAVAGTPRGTDDPLGNARIAATAAFCAMAYLFLQIVGLSHQRRGLRTRRARVYFCLLAFFPLWSLPVGWALTGTIIHLLLHFPGRS